jgi:hypothetical protein
MGEPTKTANRIFLDTLALVVYDAEQMSDRRRTAALSSLLTKVEGREVNKVCGSVDPTEITFTDTQWAKIQSRISMALGSARAESDCGY